MDRRDSLKLLMMAAVGPRLLRARELSAQDGTFASRWLTWPDMRWAGLDP